MPDPNDPFGATQSISTASGERTIHRLDALGELGAIERLPYSIKVLLESCLRHFDGESVTREHLSLIHI